MSSALPRPASNDCIMLFFIGGITSAEVRQIRETVAKHNVTNKQVNDTNKYHMSKSLAERVWQIMCDSPK